MEIKTLKLAAAEILNKGNFIKLESREWKFYNSFFDIIDTKLHKPPKKRKKKIPKHICTIEFDKKILEATRLPKIFHTPDVISLLFNMQTKKNNATINYKLHKPTCNRILSI